MTASNDYICVHNETFFVFVLNPLSKSLAPKVKYNGLYMEAWETPCNHPESCEGALDMGDPQCQGSNFRNDYVACPLNIYVPYCL